MVIETTDPITGIVVGPKPRNNYRDGYRYNNRSNYRRDDSNQRYGDRNQDCSRSRERIEIGVAQEKVPNPEVATNLIGIRVEMIIGDKVETIPETDLNQVQDQFPV